MFLLLTLILISMLPNNAQSYSSPISTFVMVLPNILTLFWGHMIPLKTIGVAFVLGDRRLELCMYNNHNKLIIHKAKHTNHKRTILPMSTVSLWVTLEQSKFSCCVHICTINAMESLIWDHWNRPSVKSPI